MAVAIENANAVVVEDGDTDPITLVETGSNRLVLACALMTDNTGTLGNLDAHTLAGSNFDADPYYDVAGSVSPWGKAAVSYYLDGNAAEGTYVLTISTTKSNSGTYLLELANVDQTTPISFNEVLKGKDISTSPAHTVSTAAGDLVILLVSCASALTISTPVNNDGDAWTAQVPNDAELVGGGLSKGSIFTNITSGAWSSETVTAALSASSVNVISLCVVVAASTGTVSNPKGPLGMPLHGAFGGPI